MWATRLLLTLDKELCPALCQLPPSLCPHVVGGAGLRERRQEGSRVSLLIKDPLPTAGTALTTSSNATASRGPTSDATHWGLGLQHTQSWGTQTFGPQPGWGRPSSASPASLAVLPSRGAQSALYYHLSPPRGQEDYSQGPQKGVCQS